MQLSYFIYNISSGKPVMMEGSEHTVYTSELENFEPFCVGITEYISGLSEEEFYNLGPYIFSYGDFMYVTHTDFRLLAAMQAGYVLGYKTLASLQCKKYQKSLVSNN